MPMTNIARIVGVIAAFLAGLVVKVAADHGLTLNPEEVTLAMTTVMISVYAFVHRVVSKKSNPVDAASPEVRRAMTGEYKVR